MSLPRPARYFPVRPHPLRMEAGLVRFGTDFGNGAADRLYFQVDEQLERYLAAKRRVAATRHAWLVRDAAEREIHSAVGSWLERTLALEHPERFAALEEPREPVLFAVARAVQEDLVVLRRLPDGGTSAIGVHVCSPSGWRPERIHGAGFGTIHGPVPGFAKHPEAERSMVAAMVERGPYVRFVWTVTADDHLDRHPEEGGREPWRADGPGFLRVERQVTVPFRELEASLFLIRVYLYPFSELTAEERGTLERALVAMPEPIARYKGLDRDRETILAVLRASGDRGAQRSPTT